MAEKKTTRTLIDVAISASGQTKGKPRPLVDRKKELTSKRNCQVLRDMCKAAMKTTVKNNFKSDPASQILRMAAVFGTESVCSRDANWSQFDRLSKAFLSKLLEKVWNRIKPVIKSRLTYNGPITQLPVVHIAEAKKIAGILSIDINAMIKKAAEDIPEPKSWANLNADGTPKSKTEKETGKKSSRKKTAKKKPPKKSKSKK